MLSTEQNRRKQGFPAVGSSTARLRGRRDRIRRLWTYDSHCFVKFWRIAALFVFRPRILRVRVMVLLLEDIPGFGIVCTPACEIARVIESVSELQCTLVPSICQQRRIGPASSFFLRKAQLLGQ